MHCMQLVYVCFSNSERNHSPLRHFCFVPSPELPDISKKNFPWPVNTPDEQLQFRVYIHSRGVAVNSWSAAL